MLIEVPQRTETWLAARAGKITSSLAAAALGLDKYKSAAAAYREILGLEKPKVNDAMRYGTAHEGDARCAYESECGVIVDETGFWVHDSHPWLGASPDGLVGEKGLVEIKCPGTLPTEVPTAHLVQMCVAMACANRSWCDYWAWTTEGHFMTRVERHEEEEAHIIQLLEVWYQAYILTKTPPPRKRRAQ